MIVEPEVATTETTTATAVSAVTATTAGTAGTTTTTGNAGTAGTAIIIAWSAIAILFTGRYFQMNAIASIFGRPKIKELENDTVDFCAIKVILDQAFTVVFDKLCPFNLIIPVFQDKWTCKCCELTNHVYFFCFCLKKQKSQAFTVYVTPSTACKTVHSIQICEICDKNLMGQKV